MKKDIEYNGYKSYNFWNQSLYINNDKSLYDLAIMCINKHNNIKLATLVFIDNLDFKVKFPIFCLNFQVSVL